MNSLRVLQRPIQSQNFEEKKMMLTQPDLSNRTRKIVGRLFSVGCGLILGAGAAHAQFSSGSTGADGAFSPSSNQTVQVPASGVFNYTTINIPSGVTITFTPNANNTPVIMLASGNVTIAGAISLNAFTGNGRVGGKGGPGGYRGGTGGVGVSGVTDGLAGDGPGGGSGGVFSNTTGPSGGGGGGFASGGGAAVLGATGGPAYGSSTLVPLIGGSGGGGGGSRPDTNLGGGGGGGGGAILIASSGVISFSSSSVIRSRGGDGASGTLSSSYGGGGGGSGGAIRIVANTISGTVTFDVGFGGGGSCCGNFTGGSGAPGRVRLEAYDMSVNPTISPGSTAGVASLGFPSSAIPTNDPRLRIASVAGVAAPASPVGSLQAPPDVVVPASQTNPVVVALEASNIAPGLIANVTVTAAGGARTTVQSTALAGNTANSTATANVTLPDGSSIIMASATVVLTASAKPMLINGERIDRIEVGAVFGGPSELTYITSTGKRIKKTQQ